MKEKARLNRSKWFEPKQQVSHLTLDAPLRQKELWNHSKMTLKQQISKTCRSKNLSPCLDNETNWKRSNLLTQISSAISEKVRPLNLVRNVPQILHNTWANGKFPFPPPEISDGQRIQCPNWPIPPSHVSRRARNLNFADRETHARRDIDGKA